MLFHTIEFIIFFLGLLMVRTILPKSSERIILVIASYLFYAWWSFKLSSLLVVTIVASFYAAKFIAKSKSVYARRFWLIFAITANFGLLFFFKYCGWLNDLFSHPLTYNIILPLGISFHTFQSMSYVFDVYRNKTEQEKSLLSFAAFVAFFPQSIAGPIEVTTRPVK